MIRAEECWIIEVLDYRDVTNTVHKYSISAVVLVSISVILYTSTVLVL